MSKYKLEFLCEICNGAGVYSEGSSGQEVTCTNCNGSGFELVGTVGDLKDDVADLSDKLDDILELLQA